MKKKAPPKDLLDNAKVALKNAYCPYSKFAVSACIRTDNNTLFTGCNVENASYSLCCCAEANAIGNMVQAGHRKIKQILILVDVEKITSPCGGCRQQIAEFATPNTDIFLCTTNGLCEHFTIDALLPNAFNSTILE